MLKVKNKGLVRKIAINSFKDNKLRNLFVVVAIVLTTAMFSCLFTAVMSIADTFKQSNMKSVGTTSHSSIKYLTREQYESIKNSGYKNLKDISYSHVLSMAENLELKKRNFEIRYAEDKFAEWTFTKPTTGRMPQDYKEIAVDTHALDALGLPHTLGQDITIEYTIGKSKVKDTFKLCGYWPGDKLLGASQIYLSEDYVVDKSNEIAADESNGMYGTICADVFFNNERNIESKLTDLLTTSGLDPKSISTGTNWAYNSSSGLDLSTILGIVAVCLLVCLCGYLIIYNIFYISVSRDIRFFGLLKSIGTTKKQIGVIIRLQAILLAIIGIPIGCAVGYLLALALMPSVNNMLAANIDTLSVNPLIFVFSAVFSLLTLFVSIRKPVKSAGTVSPIEALRNTERNTGKKKIQNSKGFKISRMAIRNVTGNKKRAVLVITSLSLSLIIFNSTIMIVDGFDNQKYLDKMMNGDFLIADNSLFTFNLENEPTSLTKVDLDNLIENTPIKSFAEMYFAEGSGKMSDILFDRTQKAKQEIHPNDTTYNQYIDDTLKQMVQTDKALYHVYGVNKSILDYAKGYDELGIDYEKLSSGNYVYASPYDSEGKFNIFNVGDKIDIEGTEFEVIGNIDYSTALSARHTHPAVESLFMADNIYKKVYPDRDFLLMSIADVDKSQVAQIESYLADYTTTQNKGLSYESSSRFEEEFLGIQKTYKTVGSAMSAVLAFIGIMNFINSMLTSIISRLREFATMQSIGMTKKQLIKLLSCEGATYAVITGIIMLTFGMAISYFAVSVFTANMFYYTMSFNMIPLIICIIVLLAVSIIIPSIAYRTVAKSSIIERLRMS